MVLVGFDTSNLKVLFKDAKVCESCCGGMPTECSACWDPTQPEYVDVTFSGVLDCNTGNPIAWLNTTHRLNWNNGCAYQVIPQTNYRIRLNQYVAGVASLMAERTDADFRVFELASGSGGCSRREGTNNLTSGACGYYVGGYDGSATWVYEGE